MYFRLKMVSFDFHVSLLEGNISGRKFLKKHLQDETILCNQVCPKEGIKPYILIPIVGKTA